MTTSTRRRAAPAGLLAVGLPWATWLPGAGRAATHGLAVVLLGVASALVVGAGGSWGA